MANNSNNRKRTSAEWAKETAEKRFKSDDLNGAIESAQAAKALFPSLDGIDQILAAYEVHAAAKRRSGQIDWHAVLGVAPWEELEVIRKQYKRKALLVHPDKNKSPAADGTFKLVSDAWNALSCSAMNKAACQERREYNNKYKAEETGQYSWREYNNKYRKKYPSALWAKNTAEMRFKSRNLKGAVDCATIAKNLYPRLYGIDEAIAAYEVHWAASQKKINGHTDWYAVLGINSSADLEAIKKQYQRKVLLVHPKNNASAAAAGALKLVTEAWNALSKPPSGRTASNRRP